MTVFSRKDPNSPQWLPRDRWRVSVAFAFPRCDGCGEPGVWLLLLRIGGRGGLSIETRQQVVCGCGEG